MENKLKDHLRHSHPLFLIENASDDESLKYCYGCGNPISNSEVVYICKQEYCIEAILHHKCGDLPSEIWHPKHPQHPLDLFDYHLVSWGGWCDLCSCDIANVYAYRCGRCNFVIDLTCTKLSLEMLLGEKRHLRHPSHPPHQLTLMRKHAFAFCCDGCGDNGVDMAYICITCEFWIHKACAFLHLTFPTHLHHHPLSLAFSFPMEHRYADFRYMCDVCDKDFDTTCWLYFCGNCRFFAHIKCVTATTQPVINLEEDDSSGSNVIQFPLYVHDIMKELITPFVLRERGLNKIPDVKDMPTDINMPETKASYSFLFNYHKHSLSLILDSREGEENANKVMHEELEEDSEKDEEEHVLRVCDVCVTPIFSPPYYQCIGCKYFVHLICYLLPKTLSPSPLDSPLYGGCPKAHNNIHKFTLYTSSKLTDEDPSLYECDLCMFLTNGMMYKCEQCETRIDVKCASLPSSMKHMSHPHHKPLILTRLSVNKGVSRKKCHGCEDKLEVGYCCSSDECNFALDIKCAMLPHSIKKQEWDKHPLLLSFDASLDHPSYFFCETCEGELHPKKWMYHCRQCDNSFHLLCPKIASGWYRNIKFGRQFVLDGIHTHALTINCVTLLTRCKICRRDVYYFCGLECRSCNFVVCLICAANEM